MAQYATPDQITYITTRRGAGRHLGVYSPTERARATSGRSRHRPDSSVYLRRRLLASGLLLLAVAAVLFLAQLIQAGIGGGPLTATGAAATSGGSSPVIGAASRDYIVQPGDTLWSIAGRVDRAGDERPLVDALDRELHGQPIYPGESVVIPSHW